MDNETNTMTEIFGDVIHRYTREQALDDGVLVDLTHLAKEAGLKFPLAMTNEAFFTYVEPTEDLLHWGQSVEGRAWDVVWMLSLAIRRSTGGTKVRFQTMFLMPRRGGGKGRPRRETITFECTCGPGDHGEPVMTIATV